AAMVIYLTQRGAVELSLNTYRTIVLLAIIPAFLAVALVVFFVTEVKPRITTVSAPLSLSLQGFDLRFKLFLLIIILFTLGNSSDAFLILRAQNLGLNVFQITLMLVGFNVLYALVSMPAGELSDKIGRRKVIVMGWLAYALIYLGFALATRNWHVWLLYVGYGLYYGMTEGVARALVADLVPSPRRASAYGLYHSAVGLTAFPASFIAGVLWQVFSPAAPFLFGAVMAGLATALFILLIR
ncbi:MAG TPA: MFS transporter, partial [Chloroflexi bacterium]|nr:MFS transporter [Chloroflexota bacterium]